MYLLYQLLRQGSFDHWSVLVSSGMLGFVGMSGVVCAVTFILFDFVLFDSILADLL